MAFTAKILSWRFRHLNIVGFLLKRKPTKGVSRAPQDLPPPPPSYTPDLDWGIKGYMSFFFFCLTFWWIKKEILKVDISLPAWQDNVSISENSSFQHVAPCKVFRNQGKFWLWNLESWVMESGIQLKGCGFPLTIGIHNPSSNDKGWNPVPGIRNPRVKSRIQGCPEFPCMFMFKAWPSQTSHASLSHQR